MLRTVNGNLLDSKETYLCHQCNCYSTRSAHLAKSVFSKYPYANIYASRQEPDEPGTVIVRGGDDQRLVANLLGQIYPGYSRFPNGKRDGLKARLGYFEKCLEELSRLDGSFAFPYRVGCGAAGGDWDTYQGLLEDFSTSVEGDVVIYCLDTLPKQESHPTLF